MKDNSVIYSAKFLDNEQFFEGVIPRIDIKPFWNAHMSREVIVCKDNEPTIVLRIFIEIDSEGFLLEQCFSGLLVNDRHQFYLIRSTYSYIRYPLSSGKKFLPQ